MEVFRTESSYVLLYGESTLWFHRKTGNVEAKPAWELANGQDPECLGIFFGLIGIIKSSFMLEDIVLLIKESEVVGELPSGHPIHKVKSITLLHPTSEIIQDLGLRPCPKHHRTVASAEQASSSAFTKTWSSFRSATTNTKSSQISQSQSTSKVQNETRRETRDRERRQRRIKEEFIRIFTDTDSFYFCPAGGDITNSVYRHHLLQEEKPELDPSGQSIADDRFFWNQYMLQDIIKLDNEFSNIWVMPVMQGYVEIKECKTDFGDNRTHETFKISLISRRSRYRAGTRYRRRGLDENGHCANYVETEQIVTYKKHIASFVQVRGSIPLYWSQSGIKYKPTPQLHKGFEENQTAFGKHFVNEKSTYGEPIVIVNLVERTGKEAIVGEAYMDHICSYNDPSLVFVTFDFHQHCRTVKYENMSILISGIQDEIAKMNYCWIDNEGIISKQIGIFRVNCIDCLDRTNVVQTAIAREVLITQLIKLGLMSPESTQKLFVITQQMWADNGDVISKQYAGTNALKGDVTRTGGRKISGMMKDGMNSANRYYLSRFKDATRQATLDIMLGNSVEEGIIQQKDGSSDDEEDTLSTGEQIKLIMEEVKNFVVEDSMQVLAMWPLISVNVRGLDHMSPDMDTVLILTNSSCFVVDYDTDSDKVTKYEEINLNKIQLIEIELYDTPIGGQHIFTPVLIIYYMSEEYSNALRHTFKSTHVRFFNNVPIVIKNNEERIESLKAIGESIQITYKVGGFGNLEFNNKTLNNVENNEVQFSTLKSVGSKALSNVSMQFSKFNKIGQSFKINKINPKLKEKLNQQEEEFSSNETFIKTAGIVRSNTNIYKSGLVPTPTIVIESADLENDDSGTPALKDKEKSISSDNIIDSCKNEVIRMNSDKDLSLDLTNNDQNKFRSLKCSFANATNVLVSPSSPLSKLAKGVQNLSSNFKPKRLRSADRSDTNTEPNSDLVEAINAKWKQSKCKSPLIIL